ncbi:unnamed protein product [Fraxinus pennsylvanica]|uniref:Fungal lipase-like domain-containing protein n=1 Tax=Fraxinus pennsylvanica TaxID=56036 RepID=A0AAD2EGW3_9LAMI|nr:unnamed protein product [Fraxinus pennsylvanica]
MFLLLNGKTSSTPVGRISIIKGHLKASLRFSCTFKALRSTTDKYGRDNICIAGHSLGAGFALHEGKTLVQPGINVEAHLFYPPSISLVMSLRNIGEKAEVIRKRFKSMLPSSTEVQSTGDKGMMKSTTLGSKQWIPHLYVNNRDYICCAYTNSMNQKVTMPLISRKM